MDLGGAIEIHDCFRAVLVYFNDLLLSGVIPELQSQEDKENIVNAIRAEVKAAGVMDSTDNCWEWFIDKVARLGALDWGGFKIIWSSSAHHHHDGCPPHLGIISHESSSYHYQPVNYLMMVLFLVSPSLVII